MKRLIIIAITTVITAANLSGCAFFPTEESAIEPPLEVPTVSSNVVNLKTVKVERQNLVEKKEISGTLISNSKESLMFRDRAGYIKIINVVKGTEVKKGDLLIQLDTDQTKQELKSEKLQLEILKIDEERMKAQPNTDIYELRKQKLYIEAQQEKVDALSDSLNKDSLYASKDGIVTAVANNPNMNPITAGDYVQANTPLVTVMDPKAIIIESSGDVSDFQPYQKVNIIQKGKTYVGEVIDVSIDSEANDEKQGKIHVKYNSIPGDARLGDGVTVQLVKSNKENVLAIPRSCVSNYKGGSFVQVMENGTKKEVNVELGIETSTMVEVKSGLKEGDTLVTY